MRENTFADGSTFSRFIKALPLAAAICLCVVNVNCGRGVQENSDSGGISRNRTDEPMLVVKGFFLGMSATEAKAVLTGHDIPPEDRNEGDQRFIVARGGITIRYDNNENVFAIDLGPGFVNQHFSAETFTAEDFAREFAKGYGLPPMESIPVMRDKEGWVHYNFAHGSKVLIWPDKRISMSTAVKSDDLQFETANFQKSQPIIKGFYLGMTPQEVEQLVEKYQLGPSEHGSNSGQDVIFAKGVTVKFDSNQKAKEIALRGRELDKLFNTSTVDLKTFSKLFANNYGVPKLTPGRNSSQQGWYYENTDQGYALQFAPNDVNRKEIMLTTQGKTSSRRFD